MEFLQDPEKKKILRTALYGDQEFSRFELELLHTPIVQRLYNLKQLGFADRVYPDAVHSRFNHIIGVAEVVDRMIGKLDEWLKTRPLDEKYEFLVDEKEDKRNSKPAGYFREILAERRSSLRIMGLLHDLTHAAYGHTLEDEVCLFQQSHDSFQRQKLFYNALVAQLVYIWSIEIGAITEPIPDELEALSRLEVDPKKVNENADLLRTSLGADSQELKILVDKFRDLELALRMLIYLDFSHDSEQKSIPKYEPLLASNVLHVLDPEIAQIEFNIHRDLFMIDMVGNTICADLIDYAVRDVVNSGLKAQFDERLLRYLVLVSASGKESPTGGTFIRLAIQIYTDKMRHDVLTEMSGVLRARYLLNERVIFHPAKCAAGAMLGTAAQLLGLKQLPPWLLVLGDQEFIHELEGISVCLIRLCAQPQNGSKDVSLLDSIKQVAGADQRQSEILEDCLKNVLQLIQIPDYLQPEQKKNIIKLASGARRLLWRIKSRRFHKLAYRLRAGERMTDEDRERIAKNFSDGSVRYDLERKIESFCALPPGAVVIHCPKDDTSMKSANVLVVGDDLKEITRLRTVTEKHGRTSLGPYQKEINAVEEMYKAIWQFHVYLEQSHYLKRSGVDLKLSVHNEIGKTNDKLLKDHINVDHKTVYDILAEMCPDQLSMDEFPRAYALADKKLEGTRMRVRGFKDNQKLSNEIVRQVKQESSAISHDEGQLDMIA